MDESYQLLGIGAGPSNLSLAALNDHGPRLNSLFLDAGAANLPWHAGLLLAESRMQTHYIKDLVTPVDPTNPYSFPAYLVRHKRLYKFLTANFSQIPRVEFSNYLRWVANSLDNVRHSMEVLDVEDAGDNWRVHTKSETFHCRNLVVATGRSPEVPACAREKMGATLFHSSTFCKQSRDWSGKRVAIVGGGQSAAEIFAHILGDSSRLPKKLHLISRRANLLQLDDSPFVNEWFTPDYSDFFQGLSLLEKAHHVAEQKLASDGVSISLLQEIYRRIYEVRYLQENIQPDVAIRVSTTLVDIQVHAGGHRLCLQHSHARSFDDFDIVILATGYCWTMPGFMSTLQSRIEMNGVEPALGDDFSARVEGARDKRLFFQNSARLQRGVADPNLSLLAWRSARILNALAGRVLYDSGDDASMLELARYDEGRIEPSLTGGRAHAARSGV